MAHPPVRARELSPLTLEISDQQADLKFGLNRPRIAYSADGLLEGYQKLHQSAPETSFSRAFAQAN